MARIRSVKPSLRASRVVAQWPFEVRYFWVLLWGYLDDEGRGLDIPRNIAADCYPLDDVAARTIDRWLALMSSTQREPDRDPPVCRYAVGPFRYLHAVHWHDDSNQRINRPTPSRLPPCPIHDKPREPFNEPLSEPLTSTGSEPLIESPANDSRLEKEEGGGRKEEGASLTEPLTTPPAPNPANQPPPPETCPKHPNGTDEPCRACAKARKAHTAWQTAETTRQRRVGLLVDGLRRGPPCPHGDPGGTALHPTSGQPLCPVCRAEQPRSARHD